MEIYVSIKNAKNDIAVYVNLQNTKEGLQGTSSLSTSANHEFRTTAAREIAKCIDERCRIMEEPIPSIRGQNIDMNGDVNDIHSQELLGQDKVRTNNSVEAERENHQSTTMYFEKALRSTDDTNAYNLIKYVLSEFAPNLLSTTHIASKSTRQPHLAAQGPIFNQTMSLEGRHSIPLAEYSRSEQPDFGENIESECSEDETIIQPHEKTSFEGYGGDSRHGSETHTEKDLREKLFKIQSHYSRTQRKLDLVLKDLGEYEHRRSELMEAYQCITSENNGRRKLQEEHIKKEQAQRSQLEELEKTLEKNEDHIRALKQTINRFEYSIRSLRGVNKELNRLLKGAQEEIKNLQHHLSLFGAHSNHMSKELDQSKASKTEMIVRIDTLINMTRELALENRVLTEKLSEIRSIDEDSNYASKFDPLALSIGYLGPSLMDEITRANSCTSNTEAQDSRSKPVFEFPQKPTFEPTMPSEASCEGQFDNLTNNQPLKYENQESEGSMPELVRIFGGIESLVENICSQFLSRSSNSLDTTETIDQDDAELQSPLRIETEEGEVLSRVNLSSTLPIIPQGEDFHHLLYCIQDLPNHYTEDGDIYYEHPQRIAFEKLQYHLNLQLNHFIHLFIRHQAQRLQQQNLQYEIDEPQVRSQPIQGSQSSNLRHIGNRSKRRNSCVLLSFGLFFTFNSLPLFLPKMPACSQNPLSISELQYQAYTNHIRNYGSALELVQGMGRWLAWENPEVWYVPT
ncbi:hypothetical protein BGX27_006159 [Mortierella sp. AM989]|nr:hypothetical protein BGX27_006159 [Mortierella sp. AM989]